METNDCCRTDNWPSIEALSAEKMNINIQYLKEKKRKDDVIHSKSVTGDRELAAAFLSSFLFLSLFVSLVTFLLLIKRIRNKRIPPSPD